jgi:quercetin dioxygenase-like cupin family protein
MNGPADRMMTPMDVLYRAAKDMQEEEIHAVEGAVEQGELSVTVLMVTENMLVLRAWRGKGLVDPIHQHDDHESVATLLSGKLKMKIGDEEFIAGPGDVWRHPPGVPHFSEALEECVQIEIKSPARKTWN